ncbi:hypothetical protein ElyMa_006622600 [Elysia marginata]|uniref:Uncharacterized protein n=1 Tax=Elysia marginata TaxID=1093978 RepID=A0AAV4IGM3_9GAST|nr:hypothetical protein ElyMa_006622600 [Elysia marginata]
MKRSKKVPKKLLAKVLEKENAELEENAKKILNEMATKRLQFSRLISQLTEHAGSRNCKTNSSLEKEILKLQMLMGLQGQQIVEPDQDQPRDVQELSTAQQAPEADVHIDTVLEEFMGHDATNEVCDASDVEMLKDIREGQLSFNSDNADSLKLKNADDGFAVLTLTRDFCNPQNQIASSCSSNDNPNVNLAESEFLDIFDTLFSSDGEKDKSECCADETFVTTDNSAISSQSTACRLEDFKVQLKFQSPSPQQTNQPDATRDQQYENNCWEWVGQKEQDVSLHPSLENNKKQQSCAPSLYPVHNNYADMGSYADMGEIAELLEQNDYSKEVKVNHHPSVDDGQFPNEQNISCLEKFIYTEIEWKKLEERIPEPAEEDVSDIIDLNQEKQSLMLKNEMHELYVGSAPSPEPEVWAALISLSEGADLPTNMFLQQSSAEMGNSPDNLSCGLQVEQIDFYTAGFD